MSLTPDSIRDENSLINQKSFDLVRDIMDTIDNQLGKNLAQMLKGGVIMDVVSAEHAKIAEKAGAVAVMALERVPSDIRAAGGVARMSDPAKNELPRSRAARYLN